MFATLRNDNDRRRPLDLDPIRHPNILAHAVSPRDPVDLDPATLGAAVRAIAAGAHRMLTHTCPARKDPAGSDVRTPAASAPIAEAESIHEQLAQLQAHIH